MGIWKISPRHTLLEKNFRCTSVLQGTRCILYAHQYSQMYLRRTLLSSRYLRRYLRGTYHNWLRRPWSTICRTHKICTSTFRQYLGISRHDSPCTLTSCPSPRRSPLCTAFSPPRCIATPFHNCRNTIFPPQLDASLQGSPCTLSSLSRPGRYPLCTSFSLFRRIGTPLGSQSNHPPHPCR